MARQESASQTGAQERDFGGEIIYPDLLLLIEQVAVQWMTVAGAIANNHRAMQAKLFVGQRLGCFRQRVAGRDNEHVVHRAEHFP